MASVPLLLVILFNFAFSLWLLNRYGNLGKHNVWITTSVFVAWFFSFNVIFILPLDITSTIYNQCIVSTNGSNHGNGNSSIENSTTTVAPPPLISSSTLVALVTLEPPNGTVIPNDGDGQCQTPWSYIPPNVLLTLWQFLYWSSQLLTWILLPVFQSYSMSGEFSTIQKLKASFIENIKYYCFFGVLFIIFLIYYASKEHVTFEGLKVFCISASNTFGLFLLTILMGYGLVEIPRTCLLNYYWNYQYKLKYLYFKVAKSNGEKCEADGNLDDLLDEIRELYLYATSRNSPMFAIVENIARRCPENFQKELLTRRNSTVSNTQLNSVIEGKLNKRNLIKLNCATKRAVQTSHRVDVQYRLLVQQAIQWKEITENSSRYFVSNSNLSTWEVWLHEKFPQVDWLLQRKYAIYRVASLLFGYLLAALSAMIIWSEFTFFIQSVPVSIFALIVRLLGNNYFWIELFSMISIAYLCACCYYTIFKVHIFNYYYLAKHHQTDEYSLIFCGMLLCRLASPLCLNFLSLIQLDSHITKQSISQETAFTQIMGHMDTISFISDHLSIYLPVLMSLFCVATFFKLGSKLVHYFGIEQFNISDEITQELVAQGENLVKRESQKLTRPQLNMGVTTQPVPTSIVSSSSSSSSSRSRLAVRQSSQEHLLPPPSIATNEGIIEEQSAHMSGSNSRFNKSLFDDV